MGVVCRSFMGLKPVNFLLPERGDRVPGMDFAVSYIHCVASVKPELHDVAKGKTRMADSHYLFFMWDVVLFCITGKRHG